MRSKDWFEIGFSLAMVMVWLVVAALADRSAPAADSAALPAPPAQVGSALPAAAPRS